MATIHKLADITTTSGHAAAATKEQVTAAMPAKAGFGPLLTGLRTALTAAEEFVTSQKAVLSGQSGTANIAPTDRHLIGGLIPRVAERCEAIKSLIHEAASGPLSEKRLADAHTNLDILKPLVPAEKRGLITAALMS